MMADEIPQQQDVNKILSLKPRVAPRPMAAAIVPESITTFIGSYKPLEYVVDGLIVRGYLYSLTSRPNDGKTAVATALSLHIAVGRTFAGMAVSPGRILYLCGENPDDLRVRLVAACHEFGIDYAELYDSFDVIPLQFALSARLDDLTDACRGPYIGVFVDTSAAYFGGDAENDNTQLGNHARDLRELTSLPGHPFVVANCHPVKNPDRDNLLPRGGGAFLAEVDANLTLWKTGDSVELSYTKLRGPVFASIHFALKTVSPPELLDHKGRPLVSIVAVPQTDAEAHDAIRKVTEDENRLLYSMLHHPGQSFADWAGLCGWILSTGKPHKAKVQRLMKSLKAENLVASARGIYTLTAQGKKLAHDII